MKMLEKVARALAKEGELPEHMWREFIEPARAAIEAMREPTQEMLDRGWEARSVPRHCWENMIDEALK